MVNKTADESGIFIGLLKSVLDEGGIVDGRFKSTGNIVNNNVNNFLAYFVMFLNFPPTRFHVAYECCKC